VDGREVDPGVEVERDPALGPPDPHADAAPHERGAGDPSTLTGQAGHPGGAGEVGAGGTQPGTVPAEPPPDE
jgi:hypothetical protein